jgi:hypothetical protein
LSHVRYTPRGSWVDSQTQQNPYELLSSSALPSNYALMLRDAARYLPSLGNAEYARSFFETKTILTHNEVNDGRPILFRSNYGLPGLHIVLGGKIDNIYDVMQMIAANEAGVST